MEQLKYWLKTGDSPLARCLYQFVQYLLYFELPIIKPLNRLLLWVHRTITGVCQYILRICYWTPMFKATIEGNAKQLYLYGGMPYISGPLKIKVGERSRISGQTTFTARTAKHADHLQPTLEIGSNVDIGWQTTIAVGTLVKIGNNTRIAGKGFLAGYPGHPLEARARAQGKPELDSQIGDIILEQDVWLATGVSVMAGVTIGRGTVVAAGSVVTKDLPPGVLAAGVPAKVIKVINEER